ncbi:hypothetical protein CCYA_CCYA03G1094 [Cyanidiococcus yangmingshanensis]|nr:hypothetical protein CCYA_CCYA03G1094 [Cyanidiococcus yangmingshanensis]
MQTGAPPSASVDVAVVGGGIVGATLALALHQRLASPAARVLVIEPKPATPWQPIAEVASSLRTVALTPASQRFLQSLGVWQRIPKSAITCFDTLFVYGRSDMEQITFQATDRTDSESTDPTVLGYIIEERALLHTLHQCLEEASRSGGVVSTPDKPARMSDDHHALLRWSRAGLASLAWVPDSQWVQLTLREADAHREPVSVFASLVVAADGARSPVRDRTGLGWIGQSYHQRAIVAIVENHEPNRLAIQRFLPHGPVAVLPLGGHGQYSNIVWSTNTVEADWLELEATEAQFLDALHEALHGVHTGEGQDAASASTRTPRQASAHLHAAVPTFRRLIPSAIDQRDRWSFPLHFGSASTYDGKRVVLVGDAAHVIHPLAGQGVNLGIADARALARILQHAWKTGRDLGDPSLLAAYTRERLPMNTMMLLSLAALRRIFAFPSATRGLGEQLASTLRGLGMRTLETVSPWRAAVVRLATGEYN